jgi:hypothetical protein
MCIHVLCTSFVKELSSTYAFKTPEIALYLQAPFKVELYGCVVAGEWGGGGSTTDIPKSNQFPKALMFLFTSWGFCTL